MEGRIVYEPDDETKRVMSYMHEGKPPSEIDRIMGMPPGNAAAVVSYHWLQDKLASKRR